MTDDQITLEYIGPPNQECFDEAGNKLSLVPGRRYQVNAVLAAYRVEHDANHWKRPDHTTAAKE